MASDSTRIRLELASGRNEITAPFQQTIERRRRQQAQEAAARQETLRKLQQESDHDLPEEPHAIVSVPVAATPVVAVPLALPNEISPTEPPRTGVSRPPWIAFIAAVIAVGAAVWWVMSQRMPSIDPQAIIQRNLADAQAAMAASRYSDPADRSALHFYSTVLAIDPHNADAIAGIDAIADRHITDARVLLNDGKVAEAAIALEKARRVRPEHPGFVALDAQLRTELKRMFVKPAPIEAPAVVAAPTPAPVIARAPKNNAPDNRSRIARQEEAIQRQQRAIPAMETPPAPAPAAPLIAATNAPDAAADFPMPQQAAPAPTMAAIAAPQSTRTENAPGAAPLIAPSATAPTAAPVKPIEPKLVKMVQPKYPKEALLRGIEGWVDVSLQVNAAGDVIEPRIEESNPGRLFDRAALIAVEKWKYQPGTTNERIRVRLQFKQER